MKNSVEILDKKSQLKNRCREIVDLCKAEIREMTKEEEDEFNKNKEEIKALNEELEELKKKLASYEDEMDDEDEKPENPNEKEDEKPKEENKRNLNHNIMKKTQFSLLKAINDIANNRSLDATAQAVIKAGQEEMRTAGQTFSGQIQLPLQRSTVTVTSEHDDVVETEIGDLLKPLRAKNVLVQAGAKVFTNLVGDLQIPSISKANVYFEGEIQEAQDASLAFSSVKLQPCRITAYCPISKQFLIQQYSPECEQAIREQLINAINSKLEEVLLGDAAGTSTQPAGLFYDVSIADVSTYRELCNAEADVDDANVFGPCSYVMSNKARAIVRSMDKGGKHTQLVYEGGELDGTKVYNTSNISGTKAIYGDFSNLAIGQWSGIDILVDPYSASKQAVINLVVNLWVDAKVLRPEAFTYMQLS